MDQCNTFLQHPEMFHLASICVFLALRFTSVQGGITSTGGAGWEYEGSLGPEVWYRDFPHCGGRMQSPINIDTNDVLHDPKLRPFDLSRYGDSKKCGMVLENVDGHTAEVKISGDPVVIRGGSLPDGYVLDQFHFHWGASNDVGSEHHVDNWPSPMEMHIVHHMSKFNKTHSASQPYGLAVLGFFFKIGERNANFDHLLSYFDQIAHKDQSVDIVSFDVSRLLPMGASHYYRYFGSLTTPPCYETVIWSLFSDKIEISQEQLDVFRTLKTKREGESMEVAISNDYRPLQALHERRVTSTSLRSGAPCDSGAVRTAGWSASLLTWGSILALAVWKLLV